MLQLNSNDYGFDNQSLGFPSVMGCQAIVLLTSQGLYGLHDLKAGNPQAARSKIDLWGNWVEDTFNQKGGGEKKKLYGVINYTHQYTNDTQGNNEWDQMLRDVAQVVNFDGEICKHRVNTHIDKDGSVYIRFDDAHNDTCIIRYKRWSKMQSNDSHDFESPDDYGFYRSVRGLNEKGDDVVTTGYTSQTPGILTNSVNRKGKNNEGTLNVVSTKKIITL